jgi:hypothetical protein
VSDTGYSIEEIRAERERRRRATRLQAASGGQPVTIEAIRRERQRRASAQQARPQRGQSRPIGQEVEQTLAAINRGIPFAQDLVNVAGGAREALSGGSFQEGFQAQRERNAALTQDMRVRRPNAAAFAEGTGNALPMALSAPAAAPAIAAQGAARGFPLLMQQSGRAAATGAGAGALYAGGTGDAQMEDWSERLDRANQGGALGAGLGAVAPSAVNTVGAVARPAWERLARPAAEAVTGALRRATTPAPNVLGSTGGNLFTGGGRTPGALRQPPPQEPIPEANRLVRLADRARMSSTDVERFAERARAQPGGQVLVDAFDDAGVRQLRPIVQSPGRTGQLAAETAERRFNEAPPIITDALRRRLQVGETRTEAMRRLNEDYARMSAQLYNPIWERSVTPQQSQALRSSTESLMQSPIMRRAIKRADELFANDTSLGLVRGTPDENLGRWFHYVKMGLDDAVSSGRRDGSLASNALRQANEARAQLLRAMDENIPGYQQARQQWAGTAAAEDALDMGAEFLRMLPDEVAAARARMTPFELEHARIGFADEVRRAVRGQVIGNRNVANGIMNDPDAQRAMAHLFDTPEQAAEFLDIVNTQNRLMRNAGQWGTGSQTQGNQAYEAEGAAAAVAEFGGDLIGGRWGSAVNRAGRQIGNAVTGGVVERSNNRFGEVLLRRIDNEEARGFVNEVVRLLREREAARAGTTAAAPAAGAATGAGVGSQRNRRRR